MSYVDRAMAGQSQSPPTIITPDISNCSTVTCISSDKEPIQALNQKSGAFHGSIAILWDIENCSVPSGVRPEDVAGNIRMALRLHPVIKGAVTMFSAYGDFNAFPRRLREGCQRTGVKLVDVPNGKKDAADKAILVDMFLFALDNHPPSAIMLISGDVDFAPALHILGQRGYTIILVIPSGVGVSSALSNAGQFVWDWPSIARGEGFVPTRSSIPCLPDFAGCPTSCSLGEDPDIQNDEEAIIYKGNSQNNYGSEANVDRVGWYDSTYASGRFSTNACSTVGYGSNNFANGPYFSSSRSLSLPPGLTEDQGGDQIITQEQPWWVQPGDLQGLKGQIVKLLQMSGGSMPLVRLPPEYLKFFGRPLYMAEYGALKLVHLIGKMSDALVVVGKGHKKLLCLRSSGDSVPKKGPCGPAMLKKDKRGKQVAEETMDIGVCPHLGCTCDEFTDDEKNDDPVLDAECEFEDQLETLRHEVQELLVCYSCPVPLTMIETLYKQRYKKDLNCLSFGVDRLEELMEKIRDVVELCEDQGSNRKFLMLSSTSR